MTTAENSNVPRPEVTAAGTNDDDLNTQGKEIGRAVETCLLDWGIDKLCTLTVDNASSNDLAVAYLKEKKLARNVGSFLLGGECFHMRCCAHILNLILKDGLSDVNGSIVRIREAVKYVRSSPQRGERFQACVKRENITFKSHLCLDVSTRWNSTYLMLEVAVKFQKAFERKKVIDTFNCIFSECAKFHAFTSSSSGTSNIANEVRVDDGNVEDDFSSLYKKHKIQEESSTPKSEVEKYLEEACEDVPEFDILNWWKVNGSRYKILSEIARDILAVPVSTVASESAFSTGGRVLDQFRSSLTPKLAECLICTQDWLRASPIPIDVEEKLDELEQYDSGKC
ncbi:zinc finger BED domain-containing protein RICESLEEPER 2-like [Cornus florida]|uniref:zinc finger BED domain-containing protein RICESLEEPER 2-like n=1 Tax=Cornus florida TaxID=4283 RepID=UPI00289BF9EA|nr:zinc finger BED domain-containing protein RICESLEEPER 2-like [Cornus florida]